jgi:hypothetical protein
MKNKFFIFLLIHLVGCSKQEEIKVCKEGFNNNINFSCINKTISTNEEFYVDINKDGYRDFGFIYGKSMYYNSIISSGSSITIFNQNLDIIIEKPFLFYAKNVIIDHIIDSSDVNWVRKSYKLQEHIGIHSFENLLPIGQPDSIESGLINKGDCFIPFRFNIRTNFNDVWHNGWIKLNATKDRLEILEIAYHKTPEIPIMAGEK